MVRDAWTRSRGARKARELLGWLVACGSLAACGPPHTDHPLEEARARRVLVACSKDLTASSELHDFSPAICQQHCPKASRRERLVGCFDIWVARDDLQRMAPGAEALMACEYAEAQ